MSPPQITMPPLHGHLASGQINIKHGYSGASKTTVSSNRFVWMRSVLDWVLWVRLQNILSIRDGLPTGAAWPLNFNITLQWRSPLGNGTTDLIYQVDIKCIPNHNHIFACSQQARPLLFWSSTSITEGVTGDATAVRHYLPVGVISCCSSKMAIDFKTKTHVLPAITRRSDYGLTRFWQQLVLLDLRCSFPNGKAAAADVHIRASCSTSKH